MNEGFENPNEKFIAQLKTQLQSLSSEYNSLNELVPLMIWKVRHHLDGPIIRIDPKDREAFQQSLDYNEQKCRVNIEDRKGATLIHLTDDNGDQIIFTENNEADLDKAQTATKIKYVKQTAGQLAAQIRSDLAQGVMSQYTLMEACNTLDMLGKA